jgi:hypothetical protein
MYKLAKDPRRTLGVLGLVLGGILVAGSALLYVGNEGIPFVEGTWVTTKGEAEGFRVEMTREEAFEAMRRGYTGKHANVQVVWKRGTDLASTLAPYEYSQSRGWPTQSHGFYLEPIDAIETISPPLALGDRWNLKLPGSWVNTVHLTFEHNRISEIRRDRWVFERP